MGYRLRAMLTGRPSVPEAISSLRHGRAGCSSRREAERGGRRLRRGVRWRESADFSRLYWRRERGTSRTCSGLNCSRTGRMPRWTTKQVAILYEFVEESRPRFEGTQWCWEGFQIGCLSFGPFNNNVHFTCYPTLMPYSCLISIFQQHLVQTPDSNTHRTLPRRADTRDTMEYEHVPPRAKQTDLPTIRRKGCSSVKGFCIPTNHPGGSGTSAITNDVCTGWSAASPS